MKPNPHSSGKIRQTSAAMLVVCAAWLANETRAAGQFDACRATATDMAKSCQAAAKSDYSLAFAQCENVSNPANRQACEKQATLDFNDAVKTCRDAHAARVSACGKLGRAPYDPVIDPANFVRGVTNPYFPLPPGTKFIYEGNTSDGFERDEFFVTRNTRVILGVTCVEVHDSVFTDGELTEDTLDWFAQDRDGNVWYFGENTHELVDGLISTIEGSFIAGQDGAKPGIIMKAHPMVGDFYQQEFSLGNAEDFAETVALNESVTVPAGAFSSCLKSAETTPLEPDLLEYKYYAPNVGNVLTVDGKTGSRLELIRITHE
jgi:hypothetical protein